MIYIFALLAALMLLASFLAGRHKRAFYAQRTGDDRPAGVPPGASLRFADPTVRDQLPNDAPPD